MIILYQVHFKEVNEADMAVEMLNGRMFGKKVKRDAVSSSSFLSDPGPIIVYPSQ